MLKPITEVGVPKRFPAQRLSFQSVASSFMGFFPLFALHMILLLATFSTCHLRHFFPILTA